MLLLCHTLHISSLASKISINKNDRVECCYCVRVRVLVGVVESFEFAYLTLLPKLSYSFSLRGAFFIRFYSQSFSLSFEPRNYILINTYVQCNSLIFIITQLFHASFYECHRGGKYNIEFCVQFKHFT